MAGNNLPIFPDEYVDLKTWSAQLLIDFNSQNIIPILEDESKWREWGNIVASSQTFARASAPTTDSFDTWRDWAQYLYDTL